MNRKIIIKTILWIIVIAVMVGIFCFSAQNSNDSSEVSGGFARAFFSLFPFFKSMDFASQEEFINSIMYALRKCAHFTIYAFLGLWLWFLVKQYAKRNIALISTLISFVYAITDEFHQYFVPGRSSRFKDVCIDTGGALTGAVIAIVLFILWQKFNKFVEKRR